MQLLKAGENRGAIYLGYCFSGPVAQELVQTTEDHHITEISFLLKLKDSAQRGNIEWRVIARSHIKFLLITQYCHGKYVWTNIGANHGANR